METHEFASRVLILPGLGNSGPDHWQSLWQERFAFARVEQSDWETPRRDDWTNRLQSAVSSGDPGKTILVGHSLACSTIVFWAKQFNIRIRGALLVAPSDTESKFYPPGTTGFIPMPDHKLPFRSIVVASENDPYVSIGRAEHFARRWGSKLVNIGGAGHINVASGFGQWNKGLAFLRELDLAI
jgi:uncharacterized protein